MIVVDTSVWIDFLRNIDTGPVIKLKEIRSLTTVLVGDVVLLEVLQGARDASHANRLETIMRQFMTAEMLDKETAVTAASFYRRLRSSGVTVRKTADLIIATFCIAGGHTLLHDDRDFLPFEKHLGLRCL